MTVFRIIGNSNPLERRLGIQPMSREDARFWELRRRHASSQASPSTPRCEDRTRGRNV